MAIRTGIEQAESGRHRRATGTAAECTEGVQRPPAQDVGTPGKQRAGHRERITTTAGSRQRTGGQLNGQPPQSVGLRQPFSDNHNARRSLCGKGQRLPGQSVAIKQVTVFFDLLWTPERNEFRQSHMLGRTLKAFGIWL
jgi:hypothetical protein